MKNVLSTLAMLAILGIGIGVVCFYSGLFGTDEVQLDPEEVAVEIEQNLGRPFLKALVERDVKTLKSFMRGDFGAAIPGSKEWVVENEIPFEVRTRVMTEEEHTGTKILDEFLGSLLDQTYGIEIGQAEFSLSRVPFSSRVGWSCQLLVRVTGVDEKGHIRTYQSEHDTLVNMNHDMPGSTPSIQYWEFESELNRESTGPMMRELEPFLGGPNGDSQPPQFALDVADFDLDQDLDIVLVLENGTHVLLAFEDGRYEDVTEATGLSSLDPESLGMVSTAWCDIDKDGYPDLVSGSRLFRNEQGKQFVEITGPSELKLEGQALGAYRRRNRK